MIRSVKLEDAFKICEIYNHYVLNSVVTFEETPVEEGEMRKKIKALSSKLPWIVYEDGDQILGFAYASEWKSRSAYKHTTESTVYLKQGQSNKGLGSILYTALINQLIQHDFHAIIGGISLPNDASIALHEKFGFEKVAQFKDVGFKFGNWVDVGYWELIINKTT
ncbi:MAG: phosphinothricin acetyltransferase [Lutibacter sp.]|nr:MAG: phosphinothricin acetyltransferase [Lutibacter sp.]